MSTHMPAIEIEHLSKAYGNFQALKDVSMRVEQGEIFGFLGPNGAGKSTAIRCMLDVIRPSSGSIKIMGLDTQRETIRMHELIGYLPGDVRLPGKMTGKGLINHFSRLQGREPIRLDELVKRFDVELKRPLKQYSKGMRQKIGIVLAFMCDPQVLLLDEPTSGLDPLSQRAFNEFLLEEQARGKTVFMSSHIMSDVERVCKRVAIIRHGELVAVEQVERLREKAGERITIEFGQQVERAALEHIPGVSNVSETRNQYHLSLAGSIDPLIKALSQYEVVRLHAEEAPLEEVFLKFYDDQPEPALSEAR